VPSKSSTKRSVCIAGSLRPGSEQWALCFPGTGPVNRRPPAYAASQATTNASTPDCKVGWMTGAKRGLWLVGISPSRPATSGVRVGDAYRAGARSRARGSPLWGCAEIIRRGASPGGLTWHFARPPVQGLDFEMDVRGVAQEFVISI
jgi:hypothetical protein